MHAIDGTHRQTQFASRAIFFNHGVHQLVGAHDGVYWTDVYAQRAANAPFLVNPHHRTWAFDAVFRVEWQQILIQQLGQSLNTFLTARWALVDGGQVISDSLGIRSAIGVAATRALRLRQQSQDALEGAHLLLATALRFVTGLATRFFTVLGAAVRWFFWMNALTVG